MDNRLNFMNLNIENLASGGEWVRTNILNKNNLVNLARSFAQKLTSGGNNSAVDTEDWLSCKSSAPQFRVSCAPVERRICVPASPSDSPPPLFEDVKLLPPPENNPVSGDPTRQLRKTSMCTCRKPKVRISEFEAQFPEVNPDQTEPSSTPPSRQAKRRKAADYCRGVKSKVSFAKMVTPPPCSGLSGSSSSGLKRKRKTKKLHEQLGHKSVRDNIATDYEQMMLDMGLTEDAVEAAAEAYNFSMQFNRGCYDTNEEKTSGASACASKKSMPRTPLKFIDSHAMLQLQKAFNEVQIQRAKPNEQDREVMLSALHSDESSICEVLPHTVDSSECALTKWLADINTNMTAAEKPITKKGRSHSQLATNAKDPIQAVPCTIESNEKKEYEAENKAHEEQAKLLAKQRSNNTLGDQEVVIRIALTKPGDSASQHDDPAANELTKKNLSKIKKTKSRKTQTPDSRGDNTAASSEYPSAVSEPSLPEETVASAQHKKTMASIFTQYSDQMLDEKARICKSFQAHLKKHQNKNFSESICQAQRSVSRCSSFYTPQLQSKTSSRKSLSQTEKVKPRRTISFSENSTPPQYQEKAFVKTNHRSDETLLSNRHSETKPTNNANRTKALLALSKQLSCSTKNIARKFSEFAEKAPDNRSSISHPENEREKARVSSKPHRGIYEKRLTAEKKRIEPSAHELCIKRRVKLPRLGVPFYTLEPGRSTTTTSKMDATSTQTNSEDFCRIDSESIVRKATRDPEKRRVIPQSMNSRSSSRKSLGQRAVNSKCSQTATNSYKPGYWNAGPERQVKPSLTPTSPAETMPDLKTPPQVSYPKLPYYLCHYHYANQPYLSFGKHMGYMGMSPPTPRQTPSSVSTPQQANISVKSFKPLHLTQADLENNPALSVSLEEYLRAKLIMPKLTAMHNNRLAIMHRSTEIFDDIAQLPSRIAEVYAEFGNHE